jgi:hypothetical protein
MPPLQGTSHMAGCTIVKCQLQGLRLFLHDCTLRNSRNQSEYLQLVCALPAGVAEGDTNDSYREQATCFLVHFTKTHPET